MGYDISFSNSSNTFVISFVLAKDKGRIVREIKEKGYRSSEIQIKKAIY